MLLLRLCACALLCAYASALSAHHIASGAAGALPSSVMNAETIGADRFQISLAFQYTARELLSNDDLKSRVLAHGSHGAIQTWDYDFSQSLYLAFGLSERLQAEAILGTVRLENVREGHVHADGSYGLHDFGSVQGWRDAFLRLKASVWKGEHSALALHLGTDLPTGNNSVLDRTSIHVHTMPDPDTGEVEFSAPIHALAPSLQPGNGGTDAILGAAWSSTLGEHWGLDAAFSFGFSATAHGYKPGDFFESGLSLKRELGERWSLSAEAIYALRSVSFWDGKSVEGSESSLLMLGPRLTFAAGEHAMATLAGHLPLMQGIEAGNPKLLGGLSAAVSYLF